MVNSLSSAGVSEEERKRKRGKERRRQREKERKREREKEKERKREREKEREGGRYCDNKARFNPSLTTTLRTRASNTNMPSRIKGLTGSPGCGCKQIS
jgi:hypothetical protein